MQKKNMHLKMPGTGSTIDVKSFLVGYYQLHRSRLSVLAAVVGILFVVLVVAFSVSPIVPSAFTNTLTAIRAQMNVCQHGEGLGRTPTVTFTTVAQFPMGYFLEDVAVRADGSMLVIVVNKNELLYLPAPTRGTAVQPLLLHTFDQHPFHIVETTRDVFYVDTTNYLTDHASSLQRIDLRHWEPGMPVPVQPVLTFPFPVLALNGAYRLSPNVILVADAGTAPSGTFVNGARLTQPYALQPGDIIRVGETQLRYQPADRPVAALHFAFGHIAVCLKKGQIG